MAGGNPFCFQVEFLAGSCGDQTGERPSGLRWVPSRALLVQGQLSG